MGSRGKKRVRKDGSVAVGTTKPRRRLPMTIPEVSEANMQRGLFALTDALKAHGDPKPASDEWQQAYLTAQADLHAEFPAMVADAILWRATFLEAELKWQFGDEASEVPSTLLDDMIAVASEIMTDGSERCFDRELFGLLLEERASTGLTIEGQ